MTVHIAHTVWFYNHLILSGTKIQYGAKTGRFRFYNHLILSGTKIRDKRFS